jgi:chromosome segregation ATPase
MEKEKLKLEELEKRFGSNIENTKKMVVSALRREASSELPQVQTLGDAKKFKERMESMIHRFGEVTGSHSKMLNYFLKKHASNMKGELGELEDLLKDAKAAISAFEQERAPAVRCSNTLNTVLQKISSARADEQAAQATQERISVIESDLARLKEELAALSRSSEFAEAKTTAEKLAQAEKRQEQFNTQLAEMFSHVSRALSKYSYGVSKETERRLRVLSEEPWTALAEQDISPYSALLAEVYKSVASGQIQLKDSDRALSHLASIQSSLPQLQKDAASISAEIATLRQGKIHAVQHAREAETLIAQHEEGLARERQWLDQLKKQVAETNSEVDALLKEVSETLFSLTGKRYAVSR